MHGVAEALLCLFSRGEALCMRLWHLRRALDDANSEVHFVKQDKTLIALAKIVNNTRIGSTFSSQAWGLVSKSHRESVARMSHKIEKHLGPWAQTLTDVRLYMESALTNLKRSMKGLMVDCSRSPLCLRLQLDVINHVFVLHMLLSRVPERKLIALLALLMTTIDGSNEAKETRLTADFVGETERLDEISDAMLTAVLELKKNEIVVSKTTVTALGVVLIKLRASAGVWMTDDFLAMHHLVDNLTTFEDNDQSPVSSSSSVVQDVSSHVTSVNECFEYFLTSDLMRLERYLLFVLLLIPFDPESEPQLNRILAMITQGSWAVTIFRDESIFIHETLSRVYKSMGKLKLDRHWHKKSKELKTSFLTCLRSAPMYRRQRRLYLASNLEQYVSLFQSVPQLLSPCLLQLRTLLDLCRLELQWIVVHSFKEPPKKKLELVLEVKQQGLLEVDDQVLRLFDLLHQVNKLIGHHKNSIHQYFNSYVNNYDLPATKEILGNELRGGVRTRCDDNDNYEDNDNPNDEDKNNNEIGDEVLEMSNKLTHFFVTLMEGQQHSQHTKKMDWLSLRLDVLRLQLRLLTTTDTCSRVFRPPSCSLMQTLDNLLLHSELSQSQSFLEWSNTCFLPLYHGQAFRKLLQRSLQAFNGTIVALLQVCSECGVDYDQENADKALMCPEEFEWRRRRLSELTNLVVSNMGRKFLSHFHTWMQTCTPSFNSNTKRSQIAFEYQSFSACVALSERLEDLREQTWMLKWIESDLINLTRGLFKQGTMMTMTSIKRRIHAHLECVTTLLLYVSNIDPVQVLADLMHAVRDSESIKMFLDKFCSDMISNICRGNVICYGSEMDAFIDVLGPDNVDQLLELLSMRLKQNLKKLFSTHSVSMANVATVIGAILASEQLVMDHLDMTNAKRLRFVLGNESNIRKGIVAPSNNSSSSVSTLSTTLINIEELIDLWGEIDGHELIKNLKTAVITNFVDSGDTNDEKKHFHYLTNVVHCFDLVTSFLLQWNQDDVEGQQEMIATALDNFEGSNTDDDQALLQCYKVHKWLVANCSGINTSASKGFKGTL